MHADGKNVREAIDAMNASLRVRYKTIRESLAADPDEGIEVRHRVGRLLMEITNDAETYGAGALALVATALGRDETSLYRYAHVAGRWPAEAITRLVVRRNASGAPISWSHLVELSTIASRVEREELLERTFAEALSVRDLVRIVRGMRRSRGGPASRVLVVERRIAEIEDMSRRLAESSSDYDLAAAFAGQSDWRERIDGLLDRARTAHERLRSENASVLACLTALRRRTRSAR